MVVVVFVVGLVDEVRVCIVLWDFVVDVMD